jgi:hypothetical protein
VRIGARFPTRKGSLAKGPPTFAGVSARAKCGAGSPDTNRLPHEQKRCIALFVFSVCFEFMRLGGDGFRFSSASLLNADERFQRNVPRAVFSAAQLPCGNALFRPPPNHLILSDALCDFDKDNISNLILVFSYE